MTARSDDLAAYQVKLEEVLLEIDDMVGAVGGSIGSFNVDQQTAYQQLLSQKSMYENKINALDGGTAGTSQRRTVTMNNNLY